MIALEGPCQALELTLGEIGVSRLVGLIHRAAHVGVHRLGKMTEYVTDLVELAAMEDGKIAEELADGPPDRLAAVDHEQICALRARACRSWRQRRSFRNRLSMMGGVLRGSTGARAKSRRRAL
jgi:hypothetical protein